MIKKLKFLSKQSIANIKSNSESFFEEMKKNPNDIDWIKDFLQEDNPFIESQYEFDFEFIYEGVENLSDYDYQNNVKLFECLKDIPRSIVLSEQFLSGFIFTFGYEYMQKRWIPTYKDDASRVLSHIFFMENQRRAIVKNIVGHFLLQAYQLVNGNDYTLLKKAYEHSGVFMLSYYTYADNPMIYQAYIEAILETTNRKFGTFEYRELAKHLSMIQSVSIGEMLSKREIIDLLEEFINLNL